MPAAPDFPPAPDQVKPQRALISLSDKAGLEDAARALHDLGVELVSTGGTKAALETLGLPVKDVADLTGFPEMMDGRVKTLHPIVHGGLLGVRNAPAHAAAMATHGIGPIDIVWIDLYPFEKTVESGGGFEAAIENIDIGGPAMIRSGSKNHGHVAVAVDSEGIALILEALRSQGTTDLALRKRLAARAFARTAAYDAAVSGWFAGQIEDAAPARKSIAGTLAQTLRYGENPHQTGAFYRTGERRPGVAYADQVQGKELGYNNIADADAAYELVAEFEQPAVVIVKHANPCGVAVGKDLSQAYARALECDAVSAFGGVIAVNRPLNGDDARAITGIFTEVVIAPGADDEAKAVFAAKKNLRLLITDGLPDPHGAGEVFRSVAGGFLVQSRDRSLIKPSELKIVTKRQPTPTEIQDMLFAFTVAKHVKSNAIVYAKGWPDRRHRRRPDEPPRQRPHRRHPRQGSRGSQGSDAIAGRRLGLCVRSLLPLRRRPLGSGRGGRHGCDPARRLLARRRGDRRRRREGHRHGLHRRAGLQALILRRSALTLAA